MSNQASEAIRAAKHVKSWGLFAAKRYCEKRGIHPRLFQLAWQLQAVEGF